MSYSGQKAWKAPNGTGGDVSEASPSAVWAGGQRAARLLPFPALMCKYEGKGPGCKSVGWDWKKHGGYVHPNIFRV